MAMIHTYSYGIVLPGDKLKDHVYEIESVNGKQLLGPGLHCKDDVIVVTKPGLLRFRKPNCYWIDCHQKRYIAVRGDHIIGVVTSKGGDNFRVDIGASEQASLSYLSFESATKRNRPDVKVGDIIYGRVLVANKDMEPEIVCIDGSGKSHGMGVVKDSGYVFTVNLQHIRKLLSKDCVLLKTIGQHMPYELAVGMNGRIWLRCKSVQETIAVMNVIMSSEHMRNPEIIDMVEQTVNIFKTVT